MFVSKGAMSVISGCITSLDDVCVCVRSRLKLIYDGSWRLEAVKYVMNWEACNLQYCDVQL